VRVALQGFAAVCGGSQSLHTNGFDEALGLPTERSAKIALRTQQVIAHESGAADTVDPFAGSYYVERLTADIEHEARALMQQVSELGGSVHAIEAGFLQREIEEAAWAFHTRIKTKQDVLVGVNEYVEEEGQLDVEILRIDPETERNQVTRLKQMKEARDQEAVAGRLQDLRQVAEGSGNLLYPIKDALRDRATIGEVCNVMREVFGEYKPPV
jgi:methylmalonyl-CoA mutase N-terminal domain/subunit